MVKIINKRARFDYLVEDKYEVGIVLLGGEVRAFRNRKATISEAFAKLIDDEIYLVNANIPIPGKVDYKPTRSRKLLLHRKEIDSISAIIKGKKLTLVPLSMYSKGRHIKLEIALAKRKKNFSKRRELKEKDISLDTQRELRSDKRDNELEIRDKRNLCFEFRN